MINYFREESKDDKLIMRPMREDEFSKWNAHAEADYINDLMTNFLYSKDKAEIKSANETSIYLPKGYHTPNYHFFICEKNNKTLGYLFFNVENRSAFLTDMMVLPPYQGCGIGKFMISGFIQILKRLGAKEIGLRVAPNNHRAIKLYEEYGFHITGFNMHLFVT